MPTSITTMSRLNAIVEMVNRANAQANAVADTFRSVISEIDAVINDADHHLRHIVIEKATGNEKTFNLSAPIAPKSLGLFASDEVWTDFSVNEDTGEVRLTRPLKQGATVVAEYLVLGLRSQMLPLTELLGISESDVNEIRSRYARAIEWVRANFPPTQQ